MPKIKDAKNRLKDVSEEIKRNEREMTRALSKKDLDTKHVKRLVKVGKILGRKYVKLIVQIRDLI